MSVAPSVAYRIMTRAQKEALQSEGAFLGGPIDLLDGFIHLSSAAQVAGTLDTHFAGETDLWIAAVDLSELGDAVRWEASRGGALFPHLYAPLEISAVLAWVSVESGMKGGVCLPGL